jgi:murein DD-endopeptidase MepM/ murein hydrolase activator NlpD
MAVILVFFTLGVALLRVLLLLVPIGCAFVLSTALLATSVSSESARLALAAMVCLGGPMLVRARLAAVFRSRRLPLGSPATFVTAANVGLTALLAFGFADDAGRALRRHGDWFIGERHGAVVRTVRSGVLFAAAYLERFDPPTELRPIVVPSDPHDVPLGPWRPGEKPPEAKPVVVGWYHPLSGPGRAMPWSESRRFGAVRPQPRPPECELGHCGVDLGGTLGEPVFAIFDGVIERIERDEESGGRAGRYIRVGHKDGTVVSRYIHLDSVTPGLSVGDRVLGGQLIGRLGRSGVEHSGPHLHFAVSLRPGGQGASERYLDPEPLLAGWQLIDAARGGGKVAAR